MQRARIRSIERRVGPALCRRERNPSGGTVEEGIRLAASMRA
jgi:hypothetical protein